MGFYEQLFYWLKKLFVFWKNYDQQQHPTSQQQQPQTANPYPSQQYPPSNSSPYPPSQQQGHQSNGAQYHNNNGGEGYGQNQDMTNASNSHYTSLRNQAIHEGDLMGKAFSQSKQAYSSGDGASAHTLSLEGKSHQAQKDRLNIEASKWIFNENNKSSPRGTVDLHGLFVEEALRETEGAIGNARSQHLTQLRLITGKGSHSPQSISRLKPAIEELMRRENLRARLEEGNSGVLVVELSDGGRSREIGESEGGGGGLEEVVKEGGCLVM